MLAVARVLDLSDRIISAVCSLPLLLILNPAFTRGHLSSYVSLIITCSSPAYAPAHLRTPSGQCRTPTNDDQPPSVSFPIFVPHTKPYIATRPHYTHISVLDSWQWGVTTVIPHRLVLQDQQLILPFVITQIKYNWGQIKHASLVIVCSCPRLPDSTQREWANVWLVRFKVVLYKVTCGPLQLLHFESIIHNAQRAEWDP